jgi:hypothetical protein
MVRGVTREPEKGPPVILKLKLIVLKRYDIMPVTMPVRYWDFARASAHVSKPQRGCACVDDGQRRCDAGERPQGAAAWRAGGMHHVTPDKAPAPRAARQRNPPYLTYPRPRTLQRTCTAAHSPGHIYHNSLSQCDCSSLGTRALLQCPPRVRHAPTVGHPWLSPTRRPHTTNST